MINAKRKNEPERQMWKVYDTNTYMCIICAHRYTISKHIYQNFQTSALYIEMINESYILDEIIA